MSALRPIKEVQLVIRRYSAFLVQLRTSTLRTINVDPGSWLSAPIEDGAVEMLAIEFLDASLGNSALDLIARKVSDRLIR